MGNAGRTSLPMLLRRFLAHEGYEPTVVINVTDVNDKIYDAARAEGVPSSEHVAEMIRLYSGRHRRGSASGGPTPSRSRRRRSPRSSR